MPFDTAGWSDDPRKKHHELTDKARKRLTALRSFMEKGVDPAQFRMQSVLVARGSALNDYRSPLDTRGEGLWGLFGERYTVLHKKYCGCVAGIALSYFLGENAARYAHSSDHGVQGLETAMSLLDISHGLMTELFTPTARVKLKGKKEQEYYWPSLTHEDALFTLDTLLSSGYVPWDFSHLHVKQEAPTT